MTSDDILVLRAKCPIPAEKLKECAKEVLAMKERGVVIVPSFFDVVIVPKDVEIKVEEFEEEVYDR